ncbi:MAG: hypothetical protein M0T79_11550 [Actinomycetota bacterium]|nr:hypothetical protein [Actinomycetota bacterium]
MPTIGSALTIARSQMWESSAVTTGVSTLAGGHPRAGSRVVPLQIQPDGVPCLFEARVGHEQSATLIKAVGGPEGP